MNFDLHIQNIGKLTDAKIRIGRFTVFAGANNTGKSYASKTVYSIFDAMNVVYGGLHIKNQIEALLSWVPGLSVATRDVKDASNAVHHLEKTIALFGKLCESSVQLILRSNGATEIFSETAFSIKEMQNRFQATRSYIENLYPKDDPRSLLSSFRYSADEIEKILHQLEKSVEHADKEEFVSSGIARKIEENLIMNFQVANLSELMTKEDSASHVDIKNVSKLELRDEKISLAGSSVELSQFEHFSSRIYLESPVYWKLKNVLEKGYFYPSGAGKRARLTGVPGYFHDLADALKFRYTGDIAFPEIYERLTGKDVLGGKITLSESNDLSFQENGRSFSLPVTAMGVANLGILALLIERKVLDENSMIFIDEPETNLHPAWQVVMAKALFDLAKGGAHVVIATHSADILKWLEVHVKKHPEDESLIALNKFPVNGCEVDNRDFEYRIAAIKQELTRPFADLYAAGL